MEAMQPPTVVADSAVAPELEEEILSRLPVKSLVRAKAVRRGWRDLIGGADFAKLQTQRAIAATPNRLLRIPEFQIVYDSDEARGITGEEYETTIIVRFLAYYQGLFVIDALVDLYLWNPATRECRRISDPRITFPEWQVCSDDIFGFGYDAATQEHKVVRIRIRGEFSRHPMQMTTSVFSTRSGKWRSISDFPVEKPLHEPGVFLNGKLHWMCYKVGNFWEHHYCIVTLDLHEETYGCIDVSESVCGGCSVEIAVFEDKIVVFVDGVEAGSSIWMLDQTGEEDEWTRITMVPRPVMVGSLPNFPPTWWQPPVDFQMVRATDAQRMAFEAEGLQYDNPRGIFVHYVESIVSPFAI